MTISPSTPRIPDCEFPAGKLTVYCEISPCSWMNQAYGMQVKLSLRKGASNAESVFLRWGTSYNDSCSDDVKSHVSEFIAQKRIIEIQKAEAEWAKASVELKARMRKSEAKRKEEDAAMLAKRKAEGYKYVVMAWIHSHGDDKLIKGFFAKKPTKSEIAQLLKSSAIKTDYKIDKL